MPRPPHIVLTPGDVELFHWLWMLRVATLGQLRRLRYYHPRTGTLSALDNVRKRLRRLATSGYLLPDRLLETRERIYFLGKNALAPLRQQYGLEQQRLYQPRLEAATQLRHALLVTECATRVVESVRQSAFRLVDLAPLWTPFVQTHAVENPRKRKHVERFVSQEDLPVPGHPTPLRIRPDLVFALEHGSAARLYFLEADRGSESPRQLAEKLLAYDYFREWVDPSRPNQYRWQRYGELRDFRVLIVTTDHRRVATLAHFLADHPGFDITALAAESGIREQDIIFDRIWTNRFGANRALAQRS